MTVTTTERLNIRRGTLADAPFVYQLMNSSGWLQFIGDRGIRSLSDAERYIQTSLVNNYQKQGYGLYKMCLKDSDTPIGLCGFLQRDYLDAPDIGFAILPEYEGKGYTFEAASQLIDECGFPKIYAITSLDNIRSGKLLSKLGLQQIDNIKPAKESLLLFKMEN